MLSVRSSLNSMNCPAWIFSTTFAGTGGSEDDSSSGPFGVPSGILCGTTPLSMLVDKDASSAEVIGRTPEPAMIVLGIVSPAAENSGIDPMTDACGMMFPAGGVAPDPT